MLLAVPSSKVDQISIWGSVIGAIALATIGAINIYSMKKWGKTGSAILAGKISNRSGVLGPFGSAVITGLVFGLGFDTATQISAITLSAVACNTGSASCINSGWIFRSGHDSNRHTR
jgi:high-affinity nickel-transport protein